MSTTSSSGPPRHSRSLDLPRVLAFYRDVIDDEGTVTGWRTIAWGLTFGDGSTVSIAVGRPVSVTLWMSLEDAATALDAHIDTPDPRSPVDDLISHGSTAAPSDPADDTVAPTAHRHDRAAERTARGRDGAE